MFSIKPLLMSLVAAGLYSTVSLAEPFSIIKDGQAYTCTEDQNSGNGQSAVECAEIAYRGPFNRDEATQLCSGAISTGPAECALEAYRGVFNKEESIRLCRQTGTRDRANCALRAYRGPYSKEEAIKLCSGRSSRLLNKVFDLIESSSELQEKIMDIKLNKSPKAKTRKSVDI